MDRRSFSAFYKANLDRIYRYVFFRVGRNESVAQDLVSEIFIKALQNFEKYDEQISRSAWIYRIAHNHLANYFRDKKPQVDLDDVSFTLVGEDGRRSMENWEEHTKLESALQRLPHEDRRLVTLKYIEGYAYGEMADILGRTADALKVATHRAILKLRSILKET
ncbi:MAG: RNA polymerase sigma factor [Patescibacteria group bacterium]